MTVSGGGRMYVGQTLVSGYLVPCKELLAPVTVTATTAGTAHAAGTWVEITPSTTAASKWLNVYLLAVNSNAATDTSTLIEIGTGGSGSETVIATVGAGYRTGGATRPVPVAHLPIPIAASTRIAVRVRSARTATALSVAVGTGTTTAPISAPIEWGVDTSTSKGLTITTPAGTGTPGAWTQITASTSAAIQAVHLSAQAAAGTVLGNSTVDVEIGIGAASSETSVLTARYLLSTSEELGALSPFLLPLIAPAGTRISARYTRSAAAGLDLIVHGIPL